MSELPQYFVGCAVPFDAPTVAFDPDVRGACVETWRRGSLRIDASERLIPLLVHHADVTPYGKLVRSWEVDSGMMVEVKFSTSTSERERLATQIGDNVLDGLSVGFLPDRGADEWSRHESGLPAVLRRGAVLRELSLTWAPCFDDARVLELRTGPGPRPELERVQRELLALRTRDRVKAARRSQRTLAELAEWRRRDDLRRVQRGTLTAVG